LPFAARETSAPRDLHQPLAPSIASLTGSIGRGICFQTCTKQSSHYGKIQLGPPNG